MHIDCNIRDKVRQLLVIEYDVEAQAAFAKALPVAETILSEPDIRRITEPYGQVFISRMKVGLALLSQMAENPTRAVEITDSDLQACFELTVITSEAGMAIEADVSCFPDVIMLLAEIASLVTPLFSLPPVTEVLDRDKVSPEVWEGYECLRHRSGAVAPRLSFLLIYQIWFTLSQLRPSNGQLQCLLQYLDQITELFRSAMQSQAASVVHLAKVAGKSRRRKKS